VVWIFQFSSSNRWIEYRHCGFSESLPAQSASVKPQACTEIDFYFSSFWLLFVISGNYYFVNGTCNFLLTSDNPYSKKICAGIGDWPGSCEQLPGESFFVMCVISRSI
jgi:hypothetical protein